MKNNPHCLPFQGSPTTWLFLSPILICQTHPYPEAFALAVFYSPLLRKLSAGICMAVTLLVFEILVQMPPPRGFP